MVVADVSTTETKQAEFESAVRPEELSGLDDPLEPWLKYINWVSEHRKHRSRPPPQARESGIRNRTPFAPRSLTPGMGRG